MILAIHVLPVAHGTAYPALTCEADGVCYFGDWRLEIDSSKRQWVRSILGLVTIPTHSGYRMGLDYGSIP